MTNLVYRAIGSHVMVLDLDRPDHEPEFVDGNERARAFDLQQPSKTRLCYCRDGCEKYFTSMFPATLCGPCEDQMRAVNDIHPHSEDYTDINDCDACNQEFCEQFVF